ncbi:sigma-54 dependent transcriptional regulator [Ahrensia sp. 13_GOM-1096m]|uniref:sigma-54-dependent transcriptional regulator n=1 Tax=Ahrensia sp. 13_GOM-1096m TaxID=1380380 RepID=UPI00047917D6|nr:sigma-54 dependent transcriptional regulator [Ahrensia sp. 13_GOM-1096m]
MILKSNILVIDDDREMRNSLKDLLTSGGFQVEVISSAQQGLEKLRQQQFDVILCDVRMPNMSGLELQKALQPISKIPIVLMSAHGDISMAVSAVQDGAYTFLEKPFDPRRLLGVLSNAAKLNHLTLNNDRLKDRLSKLSGLDKILIGESEPIQRLRNDVFDLSHLDSNVLITGETGTGKELVAHGLHDLGGRASEPFITLNCVALAPAQFEEALFGLADSTPGYLDRANGGTLFFDELGAIPLSLQPKLLRVIETKEFTPVGSTEAKKSDFRIISAANEKLESAVANGEFRQDLFFRLNTVMINLPPLRTRGDDISLLYTHFLNHFANSYEIEVPVSTAEDFSALMSHDLPGNVRELRNACERRVLMARRGDGSFASALSGVVEGGETYPDTLREAVAAFESQLIARAIKSCDGKMDEAAHVLGIGRRTLNEKIVKLGLNKNDILEKM